VSNHRRRCIAIYRNHSSLHIICAFPIKNINPSIYRFYFLFATAF
jgi:hypothetical protein